MYLQNVSTSAATTLHYPLSFIFIGRVSASHIPSYFGIRYSVLNCAVFAVFARLKYQAFLQHFPLDNGAQEEATKGSKAKTKTMEKTKTSRLDNVIGADWQSL